MGRNAYKGVSLTTTTMSVILTAILFWLLWLGKSLLLPIFVAVISVLILQRASLALKMLPGLAKFPDWAIRATVLGIFILAILALGLVAIDTAHEIATNLPVYEENLNTIVASFFNLIGREYSLDWSEIYAATLGEIQLTSLAGPVLSSFASAGGMLLLVVVYAGFLMAEQGSFQRKVSEIFPDPERAAYARGILGRINSQVSDYLAVKTLINGILAGLSFAGLAILGVEYAIFWALLIGLLNYIPYVGSLMGVMFPVVFSVVQFGSLTQTLLVALALVLAQVWVGNMLEPRMIGRRLNMSPFVVLVSLSLFSSLWGIAGAVLAIPLTSIIAVVLGAFPATRFIAILLAEDIISTNAPEKQAAAE